MIIVLGCDWKFPVGQAYGFASSTGLRKVMARVPIFVIAPVAINTLIRFKAVTQII